MQQVRAPRSCEITVRFSVDRFESLRVRRSKLVRGTLVPLHFHYSDELEMFRTYPTILGFVRCGKVRGDVHNVGDLQDALSGVQMPGFGQDCCGSLLFVSGLRDG